LSKLNITTSFISLVNLTCFSLHSDSDITTVHAHLTLYLSHTTSCFRATI